MSTKVCPVCGGEYLAWVLRCADCGVALTEPAPGAPRIEDAPVDFDVPEEEQVVYELAEWTGRRRDALTNALLETGIPYQWDGTDLAIHEDHEQQVDEICERLERDPAFGPVPAPTDLELVAIALDGWDDDDRGRVETELMGQGIGFAWTEEGALLVAEGDADAAEAVLDRIEYPDALPVGGDPIAAGRAVAAGRADGADPDDLGDESQDGDEAGEEPDEEDEMRSAATLEAAEEEAAELLSDLFVAADRLQHDPTDTAAFGDLATVVEMALPGIPPYGVDRGLWERTLVQARELQTALSEDREDDGIDLARAIRTQLRDLV